MAPVPALLQPTRGRSSTSKSQENPSLYRAAAAPLCLVPMAAQVWYWQARRLEQLENQFVGLFEISMENLTRSRTNNNPLSSHWGREREQSIHGKEGSRQYRIYSLSKRRYIATRPRPVAGRPARTLRLRRLQDTPPRPGMGRQHRHRPSYNIGQYPASPRSTQISCFPSSRASDWQPEKSPRMVDRWWQVFLSFDAHRWRWQQRLSVGTWLHKHHEDLNSYSSLNTWSPRT